MTKKHDKSGIPLYVVDLTPKGDMEDYKLAMCEAVEYFKSKGVGHFIFGDIYLHDVRAYREQQLSPHGITVAEPLWDKTSSEIMEEFLDSGIRTVIVTTTASELGSEYIGRSIDRALIDSFPEEKDIWGNETYGHKKRSNALLQPLLTLNLIL